jgi:hypothetical protein
MPCTIVGAWPSGGCPARSRADAARAYGDTTLFFAPCEAFAVAPEALAAGFVTADGAVGLGACAQAGAPKNIAATTAAPTTRPPMI